MSRRIADRYLLGEQVGAGATSRVHAALDERLGRQVAIKLLDAGLVGSADPAGRERFLREGPVAASFNHPNAVTVFDAGQDGSDLYIVMELVAGPSLAELLARVGPLAIDEAVRIAKQVLDALASAHAAGIVHRDVKPANVLLDKDGMAKLADFGIAKRFDELEDSVTRIGTVIGTPRYLAPEQATGAMVTPASDVYAVGILLFEMLTGRTPFQGDSPAAVVAAQQLRPATDVRPLRADVSPRLAATVARAMQRLPADRYPSAVEMAAALDDASSPSSAIAESDVATQLIQVAGVGAIGVRSGETQLLPIAVRDAATESVPTLVVTSRRRTFPRTAVMLAVVIAVLVGIGYVVSDRGFWDLTAARTPLGTSSTPTTSTGSGVTAAPAALPLVGEILAGFPTTDDLQVFLEQIQSDPTLVGTAGATLADELDKVLSERSVKKQRDRARQLREHVVKWVSTSELNPAIAAALDLLLAPLAEANGK